MANPLAGQDALFNQYESEYCNKSTEITRKVQALSGLQGGQQAALALLRLLLHVLHLHLSMPLGLTSTDSCRHTKAAHQGG